MTTNKKAAPGAAVKQSNSKAKSTMNATEAQEMTAQKLYKNIICPDNLKAKFEELAQQGWRIDNVIPDDAGIIIIYGKPKTFKSFLALDMALSIASGVPFHGKATEQGTVMYIAGEGQQGVLKRIEAWRQERNVDKITNFYLMVKPVLVSEPAACRDLIDLINAAPADSKPEVVFIDTVARNMKGDENGSGMADFIAGCDEIRAETGAHVVAVHHTPKNSDTMRGWSGLPGAVDFSYLVEKHSKRPLTAIMSAVDAKDHEDTNQLFFDMIVRDTGAVDKSGLAITSLVPKLNAELTPEPQQSASSKLRGKRLNVYNALKAAIDAAKGEPVTQKEWSQEYYGRDNSDNKYSTFSKERDRLVEDCLVCESGGQYTISADK